MQTCDLYAPCGPSAPIQAQITQVRRFKRFTSYTRQKFRSSYCRLDLRRRLRYQEVDGYEGIMPKRCHCPIASMRLKVKRSRQPSVGYRSSAETVESIQLKLTSESEHHRVSEHWNLKISRKDETSPKAERSCTRLFLFPSMSVQSNPYPNFSVLSPTSSWTKWMKSFLSWIGTGLR
jgi:hypothetical protein